MSFQTRKTFVHLQTQIKMFLIKSESPPIDSKDPHTIKAQKRSKDIVKIIHVISA